MNEYAPNDDDYGLRQWSHLALKLRRAKKKLKMILILKVSQSEAKAIKTIMTIVKDNKERK